LSGNTAAPEESVTSAFVTLEAPMEADAPITICVLSVIGFIPADAEYTVEVTNNALDDNPTWEDCTTAVKTGANYIFEHIIDHYSPGATLAFIREQGLQFDTEICENTLYNYIYRGDVFLNLTREHLLYKGERHKPKKDDNNRARLPKGETIPLTRFI
jgi:hypothetical protein